VDIADAANPGALLSEGLALHRQGRLVEAAARYERILSRDPGHFDALCLMGAVRVQAGDREGGVALLRRACVMRPDTPAPHCMLGAALIELERPAEALAFLDRAIALDPRLPGAHFDRAVALKKLGRPAEALAGLDAALALDPSAASVHTDRALLLVELKRPEEALAGFERALALAPGDPRAHNNLGSALSDLGRFEASLPKFNDAIALKPDYAEALLNRGLALAALRRPDEAVAALDGVLGIEPRNADARFVRGMALLQAGRFEEGWRDYESRWERASAPHPAAVLPCPLWRGESLAGRSIVAYCEQGFGDSLQFIRYVLPLAQQASRVTVVAHPALADLFRSIPGIEVRVGFDGASADYQVPLMSLPGRFGTTLETIPADVPYLAAPPEKAMGWAERLSDGAGRLKVGLVWAGDPRPGHLEANALDRRRSLSLAKFAPLAKVSGVQLVSLQKGAPAAEALSPPPGLILADMTADLHDFADTAALVSNLDLVVSADTSVAHLAGALGKPVWVLSRYDGCWRWLNGREDSPWYPTARILHQATLGAWDEVIERIAEALAALVRAGRPA
jgi:tetratricopeptide (TPR) repeat protein